MSALQMRFAVLIGWLDRQEREALAYLIEENRVLRAQLGGRRLRLTDDDRRRLAVRAFRLGRKALRHIATTQHRIPSCGGTDNCSPVNGLMHGSRISVASSQRSAVWSCGWRRTTPPGATRGSKVR